MQAYPPRTKRGPVQFQQPVALSSTHLSANDLRSSALSKSRFCIVITVDYDCGTYNAC